MLDEGGALIAYVEANSVRQSGSSDVVNLDTINGGVRENA